MRAVPGNAAKVNIYAVDAGKYLCLNNRGHLNPRVSTHLCVYDAFGGFVSRLAA